MPRKRNEKEILAQYRTKMLGMGLRDWVDVSPDHGTLTETIATLQSAYDLYTREAAGLGHILGELKEIAKNERGTRRGP